jgi:porphobilinogen synthase
MLTLNSRPRRNRASSAIRALVAETTLAPSDFIYPIFLKEIKGREPIGTMPGIYRNSLEAAYSEVEKAHEVGVHAFDFFPALPDSIKDTTGSEGLRRENFYLESLRKLRAKFPDIYIMTDVALDPYSSDGHDGLVRNGEIVNDETVELLARMAVLQAEAGASAVGPSDMMDGRVGAIRKSLDQAGYINTAIVSYTAKYASAFYGPFRDALDSAPKFGDKKSYQMNPANRREALREAALDEAEGADMLMVKPALAYLDVISDLRQASTLPIAAYNVSGEYGLVKAGAAAGIVNAELAMMEILLSIKRAGADVILTYFAVEAAALLQLQR